MVQEGPQFLVFVQLFCLAVAAARAGGTWWTPGGLVAARENGAYWTPGGLAAARGLMGQRSGTGVARRGPTARACETVNAPAEPKPHVLAARENENVCGSSGQGRCGPVMRSGEIGPAPAPRGATSSREIWPARGSSSLASRFSRVWAFASD